MRRQHEHREQGIFVAEGEKVVRRLLESQFTVISVLLPEKWLQELQALLQARPENVQVFVAEKALLETLTGFSMYQGLLAVGKVPAQAPPGGAPPLAARGPICWRRWKAFPALKIWAHWSGIAPRFNVQALLVGETCSSPFLRRAVRSSMGTVFQLPVVETRSLRRHAGGVARPRHPLHRRPSACGGPHLSQQTCFTGDCCIIFGSEGYGISPAVLDVCDEAVAIPMPPTVDSLNVGSAAAVFLYEANRQRGKM